MKLITILIIVFSSGWMNACNSTSDTPQKPRLVPKETLKLLPIDTLQFITNLIKANFPDHTLRDHKIGNLNKDQHFDIVTIADRSCTEDDDYASDDSFCRTVILWVNTGNNKFQVLATNDKLVECSDCGGAGVGDPYQGIIFEKGILSFESLYGACDKTAQSIRFKYDKLGKDWWLKEIHTSDYSCRESNDGEVKNYSNTKTKKDFGLVRFGDYEN